MKKILIVADFPHWIFNRHANEIKNRLSNKYIIDIAYCRQNIAEKSKAYDCVYVMDPMPIQYPDKNKTILGLRCEWLYKSHSSGAEGLYYKGILSGGVSIHDRCCLFHVVNKNQYKDFEPVVKDKPLLLVQHGVNDKIFTTKFKNSGKFTVGISGRGKSNGRKGFDIIEKVCRNNNIELKIAEYNKPLSVQDMPGFYHSVDVYVCFSDTEGLNNSSLESGACGCAIISTRCGAAEQIINESNGILIDRNEIDLERALLMVQEPNVLNTYKKNYNITILDGWTWDKRIEDFDKMFEIFFGLNINL